MLLLLTVALTACQPETSEPPPVNPPPTPSAPACGNGIVEAGEKCDGNCPTSCNDGQACTTDVLTGSAATCDAACASQPLTACTGADGCCAPGCNANNDRDCAPRCGNGVVEREEGCDGNCPTQCNDNVACTTDVLTGSAATCNAVCTYPPVTACKGGDGCCAPGCNATTDSDCSASCGNGIVEPNESCDGSCPTRCDDGKACTADRLAGSAQTCSAVCGHTPISVCEGGDGCCAPGCSANNDSDCSATCGNHTVEPGEKCDGNCPTSCNDGNVCTTDVLTGSAGSCDVACTSQPITACQGGDGCCAPGCDANSDSDCRASCGNKVVEPGEACDGNCPTSCNDGNACTTDALLGSAATCSATCSAEPVTACAGGDGCCAPGCNANNDSDCAPRCGNDVVEQGETCDGDCPTSCSDGQSCTTDVLTGRASTCDAACASTPITVCKSGDGCCAPGCNGSSDNNCPSVCGNGIVEPGEKCDGNCPTACNDGNACTTDVLTGSACGAACTTQAVVACTSADGCCPMGCRRATDGDCPEPTQVSGEVCTTTWSGEVLVTGTVTVAAGCTLTIAAGTQVSFDVVDANSDGKGDVELVVESTLLAQGSPSFPVVMTPATGSLPGSWKGVRLRGTGSNLQGVTVRYADTGVLVETGTHNLPRLKALASAGPGVSVKPGAAAALTDCTLKDNGGAGAHADSGRLDVSYCEVQGNAPGLSYLGNATGLITRGKLTDNRGEGLKLWRSTSGEPSVVISYNNFINNSTERAGRYARRAIQINTSREWSCSCYQLGTWTAPTGASASMLFVTYGEAQYFNTFISGDVWVDNVNILHMETNHTAWLDLTAKPAARVQGGIKDQEANYIDSSAGMGVDVMYYGDASLGDTQVVAVVAKTGIDARNNYWNGAFYLNELAGLFAMPTNDPYSSDPTTRTVDYFNGLFSPVSNAGPRP